MPTRSGCLRCAQSLVKAGADIEKPNPDGVTPLLNALDNSHFDVANFLLDQGADPNRWDMNGRNADLFRNRPQRRGWWRWRSGRSRRWRTRWWWSRRSGWRRWCSAVAALRVPVALLPAQAAVVLLALLAALRVARADLGGGAGARGAAPAGPAITAMTVINRLLDMGVDVNHQLTRKRPYGQGRGRFPGLRHARRRWPAVHRNPWPVTPKPWKS